MNETEEKKAEQAAVAEKEAIAVYRHDPSPRVLMSLLQNRNLTEEDILVMVNRTNIASGILEMIAKDKRWSGSYSVRLSLARNPRSPLTISLSVARFLRIFDLEEITRSHFIPPVFRHKVEAMIIERVPTMPLGSKKTLAKRSAGAVLLKLLQDRIPEVVALCLGNPHMIEAHLYKVISRSDTIPETILMIAGHPVWSTRPLIRFSLVRNTHTPLSISVPFMRAMKVMDLRDLYSDPSLPVTVKPFVHRELLARGNDTDSIGDEQVFEIREDEVEDTESGSLMRVREELEDEDEREKDDEAAG